MAKLSSWWGTVFLLMPLCAAYLYFSFGENAFAHWTDFLFFSSAGAALYFALLLNIVLASVRIVAQRLKRSYPSSEGIRNMDSWREIPLTGGVSPAEIQEWMKTKGFHVRGDIAGAIGEKGVYSFLPGTVMRIGLVVLMAALFLSAHLRKTETSAVHENEEKVFFGTRFVFAGITSDMPAEFLSVGEKSTFMLRRVSAAVSSGGRSYAIKGGFPLRAAGLYFRITNFGLYQPVSVRSGSESVEEGLDLDIFPPGKTETVALRPGLSLSLLLSPEKTYKKGLLTGKVYNLQEPSYSVAVVKGQDRKKAAAAMRPGETAAIGDDTVTLGSMGTFIRIQAVRDPALVGVYAGMVLALSGLLLMLSRFFWYEKSLCAAIDGDTLLIGYREEFYRKWADQKFQKWRKELFH